MKYQSPIKKLVAQVQTKKGYYKLCFTADCYHLLSTPNGVIRLSYSGAEEFALAFGDCQNRSDFDRVLQCPSDNVDEFTAFENQRIAEMDKRVIELLKLHEVHRCYIKWDGNLEVYDYREDDRAKVFEMQFEESHIGHLASGFTVERHETKKGCYIGHLVGAHDSYWKFRFKTGELEHFSHRFGLDPDLPKLTVDVVKGYIDIDGEIELIARCALKAIISLQLQHESRFGRDPYRDRILHFPFGACEDYYDGSVNELIEEIKAIQIEEEEVLDEDVPF